MTTTQLSNSEPTGRRRRRRRRDTSDLRAGKPRRPPTRNVPAHLFLLALVLYFLVPVWWLFVASSKSTAGLFHGTSGALWFDHRFQLFRNVGDLFKYDHGEYQRWLLNSVLYALSGGVGATVISVLAGYGFAKYEFRGRNFTFALLLGSVMVPLTALVIPTFVLLADLKLTDTIWAVILPSLLSPFGVYLMRVYAAQAIPDELLDAARVDGAGEFRIFWQVSLPLLRPAVVTVLLLSIVGTWNNYFLPLTMLSSEKLYPITVGIGLWEQLASSNNGGGASLWSLVITGSLVSVISSGYSFSDPAEVLARRPRRRQPQVDERSRWSSPASPSIPATPSARWTAGCSDRSSSTSAVACTTESMNPVIPPPTRRGFRTDVIELVRELGVSTVRYPGGNFVSGFRWEDSVGPVTDRPRRLDLAWHSTEPNSVGLHEFASWLTKVGGELMLALNLGTRGTAEALDLLEYANLPAGTSRSDERARNGHPEPFDVAMWCLGNEMDGPWQLGHRSATDYAELAARTARAMRQMDPSLELVVCGSSNRQMPTFGEWERVVLSQTYDLVDYISCHAYYQEHDGDLGSFLASAVDMDRFIESVVATADHVKSVKRSDRTINISFDEWNVWYVDRFEKVDKIAGSTTGPSPPGCSRTSTHWRTRWSWVTY